MRSALDETALRNWINRLDPALALCGFHPFAQTDRLPAGMRPSFVCFFGVTFAVTLGVAWEVFEYVADIVTATEENPYGVNMQSRETGVVDTMHDLIVDTIGAVVVA